MNATAPSISSLPCIPQAARTHYEEAHRTCALLPAHALVQIRAALASLVEAWLAHLARGTGGTLAEQTDRLVRYLGLPFREGDLFHDVRVAGNLGAHPEQRRTGPPTRSEARDALAGLHRVFALYAERVGGVARGSLPAFVEPPEIAWAGRV